MQICPGRGVLTVTATRTLNDSSLTKYNAPSTNGVDGKSGDPPVTVEYQLNPGPFGERLPTVGLSPMQKAWRLVVVGGGGVVVTKKLIILKGRHAELSGVGVRIA